MKIALCLSGQARSFREGHKFLDENLFQGNDVDVFVHTWSDIDDKDFQELDYLYDPVEITTTRRFDEHAFKDYKVVDERWPASNTFHMWYSVFLANQLKKEHELFEGITYDVVIRSRFDFALNTKLTLPIDGDKLYVPNDLIKGYIEPNQLGANDQFAYGSSHVMDLYSSTFWNIERAYRLGCPINGEDVMSANLQLTGLAGNIVYIDMNHPFPPGKYNSTPHSLIRDDFKEWNKLRG